MRTAVVAIGSGLAALARTAGASQPGAPQPVPGSPMRDLVWGKLNFLHTTDTHGWHAGHLQEAQYSADWGDYVSFAEHMRARADREGVDLLLVDTGDRVDGNGLYDASDPKGHYYYDIFREQPMDIISSGNHELYVADTADRERARMVPNFRDSYVASNLDYVDPATGERAPMAQRYRRFRTKNQKLDVVAFGFLFDFTGNANNTAVRPARETVREAWFQEAIRDEPDVFVVIGHVGVRMPEFRTVFKALRARHPLTPILFFGGHVHVRDATAYDDRSFAVASGRYFETIGWMSVDGELRRAARSRGGAGGGSGGGDLSFHRRYIDNNLLGLQRHAGLNDTAFPTPRGRNVSAAIARARRALDLDRAFGCAPRALWMARAPYPSEGSIYSWLADEVLPAVAVRADRPAVPRLVLLNTGAIRFDILAGPFTRDSTYIVSPFVNKLAYLPDVPYEMAGKVLGLLNQAGKILAAAAADGGDDDDDNDDVMDNRFLASPEQLFVKESIVRESPVPGTGAAAAGGGWDARQQRPLGKRPPRLTEGYTTVDDMGDDGDDTVHAPVSFYVVPNAIQSVVDFPEDGAPDAVDLVFIDFMTPWVLAALRVLGGKYGKEDVELYVDGTLTELMTGWIEKNWPKHC
ncbi:hypothetical protein VTJ83DRAFT_1788 [Remersonia thermophila]|uniref:Calcineurin-like phosphoesterase domain-containing protein n=1 Tax=Remersonia thermophila TaxID=72144 RepID=A0ABR4DH38_9PEZI